MTRRPRLPSALVVTVLVAALVSGAEVVRALGLYLHEIPTTSPNAPDPDAEAWWVGLAFHDRVAALAGLPPELERAEEEADANAEEPVWIRVPAEIVLGGEVRAADRKSSFVIDFHEASVVELVEAFLDSSSPTELTDRPPIETLVRFTHERIPSKTSGRGWDLASRVARDGVGDCTEHAVLLVALARAFGYPARVVGGLALVVPREPKEVRGEAEGGVGALEVGAYGHAWAEIHDGDEWRAADATRIESETHLAIRHLPLWIVENEGPGYASEQWKRLTVQPRSVVIRGEDRL